MWLTRVYEVKKDSDIDFHQMHTSSSSASLSVLSNIQCLQNNGAVSKINKKFISNLTREKRTLSAAATVQVVSALIIILQCVNPGSPDT
jgi:hypothetical protein